nr:helix-turn-helix domain-containing protein [Methylobacterium nodulans]
MITVSRMNVRERTVRDWVMAFNAQGPDGLIDGKAPGARPRLSADQRAALRALVEQGPTPAIHGVVRWRLVDLVQILLGGRIHRKTGEIVVRDRFRNNQHLLNHEIGHTLLDHVQNVTWVAAFQDDREAWDEFLGTVHRRLLPETAPDRGRMDRQPHGV